MSTVVPEEKEMMQLIEKAMLAAIRERIEEKFEQVKKIFMDDLEKEKAEIIAGLALDLMKMTDMQMQQDRIIITLRKQS